jgi:hypothetical protein
VTFESNSFEVQIRERAYQIWEEQGRPEGHADEHWNQAQAELQARIVDLEHQELGPVHQPLPHPRAAASPAVKVVSMTARKTESRLAAPRGDVVISKPQVWAKIPVIPALCWLALWGSIDVGPWNIDLDSMLSGGVSGFNAVRATFPLVVLAIWVIHLTGRNDFQLRLPTLPEGLWFFYAAVCLVASIGVENWLDYGYWGLAFIATLGSAEMYLAECGDERAGAASLNHLSWIAATVILASIVYLARGHLVINTNEGLTGYGVNNRMRTIAGVAMVRPTGISRFAGAIAIVAGASIWRAERRIQLLSIPIFAGCIWLIWIMQSRGSLSSFLVAMSVVMLLLGGRARAIGIAGLVLIAFAVGLDFVPHDTIHHIVRHATRNNSELSTMTGRTGIFQDAWQAIMREPLIGYGPRADRRIIFSDAQNGVLYSLLCGGFLGGGAWILGFVIALAYLARATLRQDIVPAREKMLFAQVAGIMVFFLLRTIPENTAALFSVDLMLQLPAMIYLGVLMRTRNYPESDLASYLVVVREKSRAAKAANSFAPLH